MGSWKIVNEISGRKKEQTCQIEGDTAEDELKTWSDHLQEPFRTTVSIR